MRSFHLLLLALVVGCASTPQRAESVDDETGSGAESVAEPASTDADTSDAEAAPVEGTEGGVAEDEEGGDVSAARPGETRCEVVFEGDGEPNTDWIFRDASRRIVRRAGASDGFVSLTEFSFDEAGRVSRAETQHFQMPGEVVTYRYEAASGVLTRITEDTGARTVYRYDADGRPTRVEFDRDGDGTAEMATTCSYESGRLAGVGSVPDDEANTLSIERGADGRARAIVSGGETSTVTWEQDRVVVRGPGDYGATTTYTGDCEGLRFSWTCNAAFAPPAPAR